jgi:predicted flap endonuclease-1-like 5' DNA nuclease
MNIERIEGIGEYYAGKLRQAGVRTIRQLLWAGASEGGRLDLSEITGISKTLILEWVNLADLMRIKGIGEEYSDLLEEAGVDTIRELRNRVPENLHKALLQTNAQKKLVRRVPSLKDVKKWVAQAKTIEPMVTY